MMRMLRFLHDFGAVKALILWPKFSLTSYVMLSNLAEQGVLPRTIIDVGANVGQFAVASAKLFPEVRVHSFEPQPECVTKLREHIAKLNNIIIYPFALGEREDEVTFHINSHNHSSSILPLAAAHRVSFPDAREVSEISVKVTTLDKVFDQVELESPVLLKLDIQGYEAMALRGASQTLRRVDYVVLEASFKPMYEGEPTFVEMIKLMEQFGFSLLRPIGWLADPKTGEILQMDLIFSPKDRVDTTRS